MMDGADSSTSFSTASDAAPLRRLERARHECSSCKRTFLALHLPEQIPYGTFLARSDHTDQLGLLEAFEDASFDVVLCQFGAMFFPDRIAGYAEARRVLRPGGLFVFSVWDRIEENEFADEVTNAMATVFPQDPPRFLARTPHGYHDVAVIRSELGRAGFSQVEIETSEKVSRASSAREAATAYCQGTPLRNEIEARDASLLEFATDRATVAIAQRHGNGPVAGKIQAHVMAAVK